MAQYEATVRIFDIVEQDKSAARRSIEEQLRAAGFNRCQVVHLGVHGAARRPRPVVAPARVTPTAGSLFAAGAIALALWFVWLMAG